MGLRLCLLGCWCLWFGWVLFGFVVSFCWCILCYMLYFDAGLQLWFDIVDEDVLGVI